MAASPLAAFVLLIASNITFAIDFPPLTGRVVDQANVLTAQSRNGLDSKLKDFEAKSSIQLVVATVKSLNGSDMKPMPTVCSDSGSSALLVVAPAEHKVRIEVGYGLEGTLTDALSSVIIASAILPRFKAGDFSGGIEPGVDGINSVLSGDTTDWQAKVDVRREDASADFNKLFPVLLILLVIFVCWYLIHNASGSPPGRGVRRRGMGPIFMPFPGGSWSSGGGSSGGGGASGSW